MDDPFSLEIGRVPVIVSFPHDGLEIPPEIERRMTPEAVTRPDTDWHVAELYSFVSELGPSRIRPRFSRYVVDLNRDPAGRELYPGRDNTGIVPLSTFAREPIYRAGQEPSADEIDERIERCFRPYHRALKSEIDRLVEAHGIAVVFDAHSIRSEVPRFFEGVLPDLNLGTAAGKGAAADLADRAWQALASSTDYTHVRDGRFKGGYITRHYGQPSEAVHALQLELGQRNYMHEEFPYAFEEALASRLRPVLRNFVEALIAWAGENEKK